MAEQPMNVLVLLSDQHRAHTTGCYGDDAVSTPNIDALAERGTLFENAFCTSPLCGPSRGSFFTGTHPHTNGLLTHPNSRHRSGEEYRPQRQPGIRSLFGCLRDAGYRTHASGFTGVNLFDGDESLRDDNEFLGFESMDAQMEDYVQQVEKEASDQYRFAEIHGEMWEPAYFNVDGEANPYDDEQLFDSAVAEDARGFLAREGNKDRPFCLYVGFRAPHPPWCAPEAFHDQHDPDEIGPLPDWTDPPTYGKPRRVIERHQYFDIPFYSEEMVRRSIAAYHAFVAYMDDCVGRVLGTLEELGLRENTLVVYSSDHGENLYRHGLCEKHTFYEDAIRIPLIFSLPGVLPEGQRTESLASILDVMPTVLSMTETDWPDFVEGRDLRRGFHGEHVREYVFAEYYHSLDPCRMVRDHRYKYIHTEDDINELYDLANDPEERINLAWYPQYADRVERMEQLVLADWEIPEIPLWGTWNDLNERKQRQRLEGLDIADTRPDPPDWVEQDPSGDQEREVNRD